MVRGLRWIAVSCLAALWPVFSLGAEPPPATILVFEQSEAKSQFYSGIFSSLRSTVINNSATPVSIYVESLDLSRFSGPAYLASLRSHLSAKYQDKPVGVIVSVGSTSLPHVLRWRDELWPNVPVVFAMVDEPSVAELSHRADVTGTFVRLRFSDMMAAARALVPRLKSVALVGDPWETQTAYRHFRDEIPRSVADIDVIDLVGMPIAELRRRVVSLPDNTAILYTSIYSDGAGTYLPPIEALRLFADVANAPIVGAAETFVGRGATGGFVTVPGVIGQEAAATALRILGGESPATIPTTGGASVRPIFDWRELRRWRVNTASLPPGSEIRFREPNAWDRYQWQLVAIIGIVLAQGGLIVALLYQHRRRRSAELEARQRMAERTHEPASHCRAIVGLARA